MECGVSAHSVSVVTRVVSDCLQSHTVLVANKPAQFNYSTSKRIKRTEYVLVIITYFCEDLIKFLRKINLLTFYLTKIGLIFLQTF